MENRAHAIIAVTFLLVFSLGAIVVYHWLANRQSEPLRYEIVTNLSVGGLARQSAVTFKGLTVGHVASIGFDPDDRSQVVVRLQVRRDTYVTDATYAVVAMQGLTGGGALELKLGEGSRAPLATSADHPARIPLHASLLASLEGSLPQDMANLHQALVSVNAILDANNREHLAASLRQLDTATRELTAVEQQLPHLVRGMQRSVDQSHALLANANSLVHEAQKPLARAAGLEDSIAALARSSRQLSERLGRQTLPDTDALSQNLLRTSQQLEQLLRELKAKPQSLFFGPPRHPPGPGEPGFKAGGKQERQP